MIIKPADRLASVVEYYFSQKLKEIATMRASGIDVINLGIGSPDLAPDASVIETLKSATNLPNANQYQGYTGIPALRQAFANWYKRHYRVTLNPDSEILPLLGSKEGIVHISMSFLNAGDQVLVPNPGYPAYSAATYLAGATPLFYDLTASNSWLPDFDALEKMDLSKVKIMWINYPNMPTGANGNLSFFKKIIAFAKKNQILVINDNPYSFILNQNPISILEIDGADEVAMELNSLSKTANMAGWRVGVLVGRADYISTVLRFKSNMDSGMFLPIQQAAITALELNDAWQIKLNEIYAERKLLVLQLLDLMGCAYEPDQQGMFVWAKANPKFDNGFALSDFVLQKAAVFITPGGIFGSNGDHYIRVSLCSNIETLQQSIDRIKPIF